MLIRSIVFISMALLAKSAPLWPADNPGGSSQDKAVESLVRSSLDNEPGLAKAKMALQGLEAEVQFSDALEDPSASVEGLSSGSGDQKASYALRQSLPINGVGNRRRTEAMARAKSFRSRYQFGRQELVALTMKDILRLQQVAHEVELLKLQGTLADKALERLDRLASLTSEQTTSKKTFEWNQSALAKRISALEAEAEDIHDSIAGRMGAAPESWDFVGLYRPQWPEWPAPSALTPLPQVIALAELQAAQAGVGIEAAQAWPGPSIAGRMDTDTVSGVQDLSLGLGIEFTLPVFNRNRQARVRAGAEERQAQIELKAVERAIQRRRTLLERKYKQSTELLKNSKEEAGNWRKEFESVQGSYLSGRLPVAAALEAARQLQEAVEAAHSMEMSAAACLWEIRVIDGSAESAILGTNFAGATP